MKEFISLPHMPGCLNKNLDWWTDKDFHTDAQYLFLFRVYYIAYWGGQQDTSALHFQLETGEIIQYWESQNNQKNPLFPKKWGDSPYFGEQFGKSGGHKNNQ